MGAEYLALLRDPRWQRKRTEVMQRDNYRCVMCADAASTLHVHHMYYIAGRNPWEYPEVSLWTLCENCHGCWSGQRPDRRLWSAMAAAGLSPLAAVFLADVFIEDGTADSARVCLTGEQWRDLTRLIATFLRDAGASFPLVDGSI